VLIPDIEDFEARWSAAFDSMERAIALLRHPQDFGAISSNDLPYASILPVFAALQAHIKTLAPNRRLDAQRKVRHWYWASEFRFFRPSPDYTSRYPACGHPRPPNLED
jgi:hypothetical protein